MNKPGRKCAWCGKAGGSCMSLLKARCDRAGVKLKGKSQRYFHPGSCVNKTRLACDRAENDLETKERLADMHADERALRTRPSEMTADQFRRLRRITGT